jgi:phospholipase/carboxylesterase
MMSPSRRPLIFEAGTDTSRVPLVLLHGSYGTESDLLPLAARLAPGSSRLAVRGAVAIGNGYAFFRRHLDRRVDEADVGPRVRVLASLICEFGSRDDFAGPPVVVGFSNGAIMAAALVATYPELLAGAVLFRPLSPFGDEACYQRSALPVLVLDGAQDARRSATDGLRLAECLGRAGAVVTHRVLPTGHALTVEDEEIARDWLVSLPPLG